MVASIDTVIASLHQLGADLSALYNNPINPFAAADAQRLINWAGAAVAVINPYLLNLKSEGMSRATAQADLNACQAALDAVHKKLDSVLAGSPPPDENSTTLIDEAKAAITLAQGLS